MNDAVASSQTTKGLSHLTVSQFGRAQIWLLAVLIAVAVGAGALGGMRPITAVFLREQDLGVALVVLLASFVMLKQTAPLATVYPINLAEKRGRAIIAWLAVAVFALGWAGSQIVFAGYPLSFDEFWAVADGEFLSRGVPMARLPEEWREYAPALQPTFVRIVPEEGLWMSNYLPVNAMLQWIGGTAASPLMAAGSVAMVALIARRLMPQMREAPLIAAILLATSSQVVILAMTPYAMTAHLLFDLVWLWLFIQRRAWAYALSLVVAALAMGLHQEAYFPLFALPFLLERFLAGERAFSILYVALIGAGFLAWNGYDAFAYAWFAVEPETGSPSGSGRLVDDLIRRVTAINVTAAALMGANLLRFSLWQNPIVPAVLVLAAWPIVRLSADAPRELRAMLLSIVGTALFLFVVIPFQGHGWGYRYLHGQLGGAVLIVTFALCRLIHGEHGRAWKGVVVGATFLAMLLIPIRAWQAHHFASPYAEANTALLAWEDADVIVIDAPSHSYTVDLTRNDPWLRNPVKRMDAQSLSEEQLDRLCARYRVRFFKNEDAMRFSIPERPESQRSDPSFPDGCLRNVASEEPVLR